MLSQVGQAWPGPDDDKHWIGFLQFDCGGHHHPSLWLEVSGGSLGLGLGEQLQDGMR